MFAASLNREILGIIFDWGDTLIRPPGLTTDYQRHFLCLETLYRGLIAAELSGLGNTISTDWEIFKDNYQKVALEQIKQTHASGREHSFEERFERTFALSFPRYLPDRERICQLSGNFCVDISQMCTEIKDAKLVLSCLQDNFSLGLLSNYPDARAVHSSLDRFRLSTYFDAVTVSGEIGWAKPHWRAFGHIISALKIPPDFLLFVGDDINNDIEGASSLGFATAWLPRAGEGANQSNADVKLNGLTDLLKILNLGKYEWI